MNSLCKCYIGVESTSHFYYIYFIDIRVTVGNELNPVDENILIGCLHEIPFRAK